MGVQLSMRSKNIYYFVWGWSTDRYGTTLNFGVLTYTVLLSTLELVSAACPYMGKGLEHGSELPQSSTFRYCV